MALDTNCPSFIQANSFPAEITRRGTYGFMLARDGSGDVGSVAGGVVNLAANDFKMTAPVSGMSVNITVGELICPGTSTTTQGGYYMRNASTTNLSIATSDPSNPRVDLVCATTKDAQYSGASNTGVLQVLTGTPTSGATLGNLSGAPSLPTSSLLIGYVLVPANATNIISADLGDHRVQVTVAVPYNAGAWTTWTPSIGGTGWSIGNGTFEAAYRQLDPKTVALRIVFAIGGTTAVGSGNLTISLPSGMSGGSSPHGQDIFNYWFNGTNNLPGICDLPASATSFTPYGAISTSNVALVPFDSGDISPASGNSIHISGVIQIA